MTSFFTLLHAYYSVDVTVDGLMRSKLHLKDFERQSLHAGGRRRAAGVP